MKLIKPKKIKNWIISHKKTSVFLMLLIIFTGYKIVSGFSSEENKSQYITSIAEKGDIVSLVNGIGQVSASNRVDVASEVSGDITFIPIKLGDTIKKGQTLVILDNRNALRTVENAELSLENAKIAYEKSLKKENDQSENSPISDLNKAYDNGLTAISNALIDIPDIVTGMNNIFYNPTHSSYFGDININSIAGQTGIDYKYEAGRTFDSAKNDYEIVFRTYKTIRTEDREKLVALIEDTYAMAKKLQSAVNGSYNAIDYIKQRISTNIPNQIAIDKNTLGSYISKLNSHTNSLSNVLTAIEDAKDSASSATLNFKSAQLNLSKAEDSLRDAKEKLANHYIRAPFDGIIGKVYIENGDKINSNGVVATIITNEKIAEISLNEVDVSKVETGQKATLVFDAIDNLTITGTVTEVDLLGTVTQGVVNYTVKIAFDANDERIRTGMSLSADIVSESKQNIIRVPNSAIKFKGDKSFIETLDENGAIIQTPVQIGLSNDEFTEIISGLNEGETYISRSVTQSFFQTTSPAPSLFGGGGGGGAGRAGGGAPFQR